jgi:hypothetical protein
LDRQSLIAFHDELAKIAADIDDLEAPPYGAVASYLRQAWKLGKSSSWMDIGPVGQREGRPAPFMRVPWSKEKRAEPPPPKGISAKKWDKILQRRKPKHIFIVGVPASGKTTDAHRLERRTGMPVLHGDAIRVPKGTRPGTAELRAAIKKLKAPHIIEGVQVMGLRPEEVEGHDLRIIEPPKRTIVGRLMRRGWNPETGSTRYDREGANELYNEMSQNLSAFKNRLPRGK